MAGARLSALGMRRVSAATGLVLSCLNGCSGEVVNLGSSGTLSLGGDVGAGGSSGATGQGGTAGKLGWQNATLVVSSPRDNFVSYANGTLMSEAAQIYFTSQERGATESYIQRALRSGTGWSEPSELVFDGASVEDASSPAISLTGNQLWFGSRLLNGADNTDIWLSTGAGDDWSMPSKVEELNSPEDDAARQPAVKDTLMPLSSKRHGGQFHQIYLAQRAADDQPWMVPSQALLGTINSPDYESTDGFLTADGLTLLFSSTRDGRADLFRATRASLVEPFGDAEALEGPNTLDFDERDPWLRERDQQLFFSSNRSGIYEIYSADPRP